MQIYIHYIVKATFVVQILLKYGHMVYVVFHESDGIGNSPIKTIKFSTGNRITREEFCGQSRFLYHQGTSRHFYVFCLIWFLVPAADLEYQAIINQEVAFFCIFYVCNYR